MNKHYFTFTICHVLNLFNYLETKIKKWSILRISRSWCGQKLTRAALKIPDLDSQLLTQMPNVAVFSSYNVFSSICRYIRSVWKVGCAYSHCKVEKLLQFDLWLYLTHANDPSFPCYQDSPDSEEFLTFFVCNFSPGGNKEGEPVYTPG